MGRVDNDLLRFLLRHGELIEVALKEFAVRHNDTAASAAARDVAWLYKVNRPDWSHVDHTADCMSDWAEAGRDRMTPGTVEANHRLHMGHVERIDAANRAER